MTDHIVQAFDAELQIITQHIDDLGQLVEEQVVGAMWALKHANASQAQSVKEFDQTLDQLAEQIEAESISLIARRQPLAVDLRHVMAAIRIASNLERAGDLASNIAKRAVAVSPKTVPEEFAESLERMTELALAQLRDARLAFAARDAGRAQAVWERDAAVDALHTILFKDIVQALGEQEHLTLDLAHLLFVIKNIERIGDHATNIAENVIYLVRGEAPAEDRPKQDGSSLVSKVPSRLE